jgi:hypothetical protein
MVSFKDAIEICKGADCSCYEDATLTELSTTIRYSIVTLFTLTPSPPDLQIVTSLKTTKR